MIYTHKSDIWLQNLINTLITSFSKSHFCSKLITNSSVWAQHDALHQVFFRSSLVFTSHQEHFGSRGLLFWNSLCSFCMHLEIWGYFQRCSTERCFWNAPQCTRWKPVMVMNACSEPCISQGHSKRHSQHSTASYASGFL